METRIYTVSIPANTLDLSAETVKKGVERRANRQAAKARSRKKSGLALFTLCILLTATAGIGALRDTSEKLEAEEPVVLVKHEPAEESDTVWDITEYEREVVMYVVMSTARGESITAMQAVAQAVRNACEDFDMTVSEVIEMNRWSTEYDEPVSREAMIAVDRVIAGDYVVSGDIYYAHNEKGAENSWHENHADYICQIGSLRFYA